MSGNDEWWDNYFAEQRENRMQQSRQEDAQRKLEGEEFRRQLQMRGTATGHPTTGADMLKTVIGCALLIPVLFVAVYLIGWAIATFVVR